MADGLQDEDLVTVVVGEDVQQPPAVTPEEQVWEVDEACAAAVDVARSALAAEAPESAVGEHTGLVADGPLVVTHYFDGHVPGYNGWRWAVTVTRAPDSDAVTVDETALLPDSEALLAPAWVPWKMRIQPGDLGTGDVLVTEPDDPRLLPGMAVNDEPDDADDQVRPEQWERGMGRVRVLSPVGRRDAAQRWYREAGPRAATRHSDLRCASCGFLLLIGGPLGQAFGVCANGYSPADGRVVAMTFGCGAHSETVQSPPVGVAQTVVDEVGYDEVGEVEEPAEEPVGEPSAQDEGSDEQPSAQDDGADEQPSPQDGPPVDHATMQEPEEDA